MKACSYLGKCIIVISYDWFGKADKVSSLVFPARIAKYFEPLVLTGGGTPASFQSQQSILLINHCCKGARRCQ
jgi:hypothetical protein